MSFQCFDVSLELVRSLRSPLATLRTHDRSLADQAQRAAQSVPLNVAEARCRAGRDRRHLFRVARGSAAEARAALEVALAWGYVDGAAAAKPLELLDRLSAMLWRLGG
jgi:four helix bundle protein